MANSTQSLIGWPLMPVPDAHGELHFPTLEESVRQQIQVILRTRPGEQLMRPIYGAGLENFLHEQNTITTRRRIQDAITDALASWEPRINVNRVEVNEVPDEPARLRVEISYQLKRTGAQGRLGVTMELEA